MHRGYVYKQLGHFSIIGRFVDSQGQVTRGQFIVADFVEIETLVEFCVGGKYVLTGLSRMVVWPETCL